MNAPALLRRRLLTAAMLCAAPAPQALGAAACPDRPITRIVPYKGLPAVLNELQAAEIDVAFEILGEVDRWPAVILAAHIPLQ